MYIILILTNVFTNNLFILLFENILFVFCLAGLISVFFNYITICHFFKKPNLLL